MLSALGKGKHSPCANVGKLYATPLNLMNDVSNTAYRVAEHNKRVAAARKIRRAKEAKARKIAKRKAEFQRMKK